MFLRALIAFFLLPGVVAFAVPLLAFQSELEGHAFHTPALIPLVCGTALLLWCVREFYVAGKGTLAPWSPPRRLVIVGAYRWSRNPMYVAVSAILIGWAAAFWSGALLVYALIVIAAFHVRIVFGEEPWLDRTHGDEWRRYKARVPRWLGRIG